MIEFHVEAWKVWAVIAYAFFSGLVIGGCVMAIYAAEKRQEEIRQLKKLIQEDV